MVARAAVGELVDQGMGPFSLAEMQTWGEERTVRAAVLQYLLVAEQWPVHARGVRLRGVRISGHLDLEAATLRCQLSLERCYFDADEPARLDYATASRVILTRCRLAGLRGEMLTAEELNLRLSTLTGPLSLSSANITGQLNCNGTQLEGADGDRRALIADDIRVGGGVYLQRLTAAGAVRLPGADITGLLSCRDARLKVADLDGNALFAERMTVGGVYLDRTFTAAGAVQLSGADITSQLSCNGGQLKGADLEGNALVADSIKVRGGGVHLHDGFTAAGAVWLAGADITGQLNCSGAQLTGHNRAGDALVVAGTKISGDVFLDDEFTAAGTVVLTSARVGGSVFLEPAGLAGGDKNALTATRAQISTRLRWAPKQPVSGLVDLADATVGQLEDDWSANRTNGYWPTGGRLRLDGFTYGRFGGAPQVTVKHRLAWIRSQYQPDAGHNTTDFASQPYEQLASVYRHAGQDDQARKVAIARRADLRKYGNLNLYRKFGNWFLDKSIKYGYETWRAAAALAAVFVVFSVFSFLAQQHHLMEPVGITVGLPSLPSATKCTSSYPCFYPVGYTIDTVIPLINVHQAANWGPDGHAPWGHIWVAGTWVATVLGWALATLLVAGYTGLVRRE